MHALLRDRRPLLPAMPPLDPRQAPLRWLSQEYYKQNGTAIEILPQPPTPIEFARLIHVSRPVVIRGNKITSLDQWSNDFLINAMGEREISIAITPNGRADAVTTASDGRAYFVEPLVEKMTMHQFLHKLSEGHQNEEILYLQSQNGNLFSATRPADASEFIPLQTHLPSDIPWCTEALGCLPDAVNLWIGDENNITSIHNDPYENIYTVLRGKKHFTLLPPVEGWCLNERLYPHATYTRDSSHKLVLTPSGPEVPYVRWSSIRDPHIPGHLPFEAHPISVSLSPGETLYLPAGWWHHVRQSDGVTIALNWWYDMEMRGISWVLFSFIRGVDVPRAEDEDVQ